MPVRASRRSELTLLERPHPDSPALDGTALARIRPPASIRRVAALLAVLIPLLFVASLVVPWQQSAFATGRVIAFAPQDREQPVEAPVSGRLATWYVQEGQAVEQGDPLVEIVDNDPDMLERLVASRDAAEAERAAGTDQIASYARKLEAALAARDLAVAEIESEIQETLQKRVGEAAEAEAAAQNLARVEQLTAEGIASVRELELARMSDRKARATLDARDRDIAARRQQQAKARAEADAKAESARAELEAARSKLAEVERKVIEASSKLARQSAQIVRAPRDGRVFRLHGGLGGGQISAGDVLVTLVPDTDSRAVELWMDGNDMPFVGADAHVRLVFEGWPALQFVGLHGASAGTFAGRVAFIDSTDDGSGKFRVVVVPDHGAEWPEANLLRQGVRAKGFLLLGRVPLGVELWRQINGFPPTPSVEKGSAVLLPSQKKPRTPPVLK